MCPQRQFFTQAEDQMILKWREKRPDAPWSEIALKLKGKTAKQCNDRYNKHLKASRNDEPWSVSEDRLLEQLVEEHGHSWVIVSKLLGTRSNIETKNRWSVLQRMKSKAKKAAKIAKEPKAVKTVPVEAKPVIQQPEQPVNEPQATIEEFIIFEDAGDSYESFWNNLNDFIQVESEQADGLFQFLA